MPEMSPEERAELQAAAELHRPLAKAASLARTNGTSIAIFGGLTLLFSLPGLDLLGLAIGAVVTVTGVTERRLAPRLEAADESAPRLLCRNELTLLAGIVVYALLKLTWLRESGEELAAQVGDAGGLGIDIESLVDSVNTLVYATVIGVAVLYQGGMARYFLRRGTMIATYRARSPEWARKLVEELGG